jgi:chromosome segregation ATPase
MFTFKWIEMMNWDFWSHVRLPLDEQVVLIAGPNGSGKTTLLDALRVLLNARKLSTSRKMPQYLRDDTGVAVIKAVVTNPLKRGTGRRPFSTRGLFDEEVTIACVLERKQGGWQRRYLITGGDASIEQLRALPRGLGPEEYSRALEDAHVPRTLLKILALEQGETHKLASRTPEQLLEYVLELQGDKQVLDRYADARSTYLGGQRDLEEYENRLKMMAMHVDVLRRDAEQYRELQVLTEQEREVRDIRLPAARLAGLVRELTDLEREQSRAKLLLDNADGVLAGFSMESAALREEVETVRSGIEQKRAAYQELLKDKERLDGQYRDLKRDEAELAELGGPGAVGDAPPEAEALRLERGRLVAAEASTRGELQRVLQKISDLRAELSTLDRGEKRSPPEWVSQMLRELRVEGIEAAIVADLVEIQDPRWQVAVESILGRERFTVLVGAEQQLAARKIAQRLKYRCYVEPWGSPQRPQVRAGSALSVVSLTDKRVPETVVHMLNSVQLVESVEEGHRLGRSTSITPDGYRQDTRGGIFVGVSDLYCGSSAGGHRRGQIESELGQMRQLRDGLEASLAPGGRRIAQIDELLLSDKVRDKVLRRIGDASTLVERIAGLADQRRAMTERLMNLLSEIDADNNVVLDRERRVSLIEYRNRESIIERDRARAGVASVEARRLRIVSEVEDLRASVPVEMQTEAARELLESEVTLIERLNLVRERISRFEGNRDPRAVGIWERASADLAEHERTLVTQRRDLTHGSDELQLARTAYKRVVAETIRRYRTNVLRLGELCRVEVQVKTPGADLLKDDSEDLLGKAGLEVRIGFDGKKPVAVDDPKLSGGQSVVASLILLMALTMQDGTDAAGFFILDEPFAHLSVERIDEVARFLQVTRAQFIITTPTTHNLLVYNPAQLTLNLRKKGGTERHAPVPTFLRR